MGLPWIYGRGTNRAAKEGNGNTCNTAQVMGCTPESWPLGTPKPCALPVIPMFCSPALNPAHQLRSGGHLLPHLLNHGAMESSTSHLAGPKQMPPTISRWSKQQENQREILCLELLCPARLLWELSDQRAPPSRPPHSH